MKFVRELEMQEAGFGCQNTPDGLQEDPEPYFDANEIQADSHRAMAELAEEQLIQLTTPGWRFLFSMTDDASPEQVAELNQIEADHFRKHGAEINRLKRQREYHYQEWRIITESG